MTREQAEQLVRNYCMTPPPADTATRLEGVTARTPGVRLRQREHVPNGEIVLWFNGANAATMAQDTLDAIIYID